VTGVTIGVLVLLVLALGTMLAVVAAKAYNDGREPGQPDELSNEVVTGLLAELRRAQAEAARWKATAERLQRERDDER
jgi:hypothetical protein